MRDFIHDVPAARIVFGSGFISRASAETERLKAKSVMLVSGGPESIYADAVAEQLGNRLSSRFTDVVMHVPVEVARLAIEQARDTAADLLLAVGGGSSIGMAKAVAKELHLPILAIPTTYAGSEMTSIWGMTENSRKTTGRDLAVLPATVIYDPETTLSLPVDLSMASGMNALAHLIEALYAPDVSPISVLQCQEGIRSLAHSLPLIKENPLDLEARSEAQFGSSLAGWALGTNAMGIHHKICHTLGGTFNLPHAQTHSAVIAYATAFNELDAPFAMSVIRAAFLEAGFDAPSAAAAVWQLADSIGAPTNLHDLGFTANDIPQTVGIVVAGQPTNPRLVDSDGVRELLSAAIEGKVPTSSASLGITRSNKMKEK